MAKFVKTGEPDSYTCVECEHPRSRHAACCHCGNYVCPDQYGEMDKTVENDTGVFTTRGWACMNCIKQIMKESGVFIDHLDIAELAFIAGMRFAMSER